MDLILNWLWQGAAVAAVAAAALRWLAPMPARMRDRILWAALLAVVAVPFAAAYRTPDALAHPAAAVQLPRAWWTSGAFALGLGAAWAAVHGARLVVAAVAIARARRACRRFPSEIEARLSGWNRVRPAGRPARLMLSPHVQAAAVLGVGAPVIAIAPALLAALDEEELDRVVLHEWAHVQRRDDLTNAALAVVGAIAGWHPAVWWLDRRLRLEREMACDELAVATTGTPKAYAACLAKLASLAPGRSGSLVSLGVVASSGLRARVSRVLTADGRGPVESWRQVAIAAGAAPGLVALVVGGIPLVVVGALRLPAAAPLAVGSERLAIAGGASGRVPGGGIELEAPITRRGAVTRALEPPNGLLAPEPAPLEATRLGPPQTPLASVPLAQEAAAPSAAWHAAADAGLAVGRRAREAALDTAGLFTRVGRSIAGSF